MSRTRTPRWLRRLWRNEQGGTLAELSIMIPFLVIMLATVAELGRFFQTYTALSKATRAASRYLSNVSYEEPYIGRAKNIAFCGKINCTGQSPVVKGLEVDDVVLDVTFPAGGGGIPEMVRVSIQNYSFQPVFDPGALLHSPAASLALPVEPSTTMRYMWTEASAAEEPGG